MYCCPATVFVLLLTAVSAFVTHGVFPNFSWMKFKPDNGGALTCCIAWQLHRGLEHLICHAWILDAALTVQQGQHARSKAHTVLAARPTLCSSPLFLLSGGAADGFRYFWMSDSCPQTVRDITGKAPFEVLSLAAPIASALQI